MSESKAIRKRIGRPKGSTKPDSRSATLKVRVQPEQLSDYREAAKPSDLSEWVRSTLDRASRRGK